MKICFLARPSFDYYSPELFNRLKQKDSKISGVFITTNKNETNRVQNRINENEDYSIFETATYLREHWNEFNNDQLTYYEKKYECAPIWKYIYTDRFLIYRDYEYCIKITAGLFSFFAHPCQHLAVRNIGTDFSFRVIRRIILPFYGDGKAVAPDQLLSGSDWG